MEWGQPVAVSIQKSWRRARTLGASLTKRATPPRIATCTHGYVNSVKRPRQDPHRRCGTHSSDARHATSLQTPGSPLGRAMNRDAVRHVATKNIHAACGDVGRGNLRENREDPAPTVGHMRGCNRDAFSRGNISDYRLFPSPLRIPSQTSAPPINAAAREGRALAPLGTSPTKIPNEIRSSPKVRGFPD